MCFWGKNSLKFQTAHSHADNTIATVSEWVWCMEGVVDVLQYYCDMLQSPSSTKVKCQMFGDATRLQGW